MIYFVGQNHIAERVNMICPPGAAKAFELDVDALEGYGLTAESPNAGVTIWAKANPGDAFTEITDGGGLTLSGYSNARRKFYFELRVDIGIVLPPGDDSLMPTIFNRLA
jgi:hypothetical protein